MNNVSSMLTSLGFTRICDTDKEILDFIHNMRNNEHCILIFNNENRRDQIVKEFFNPEFLHNTTTACFTHKLSKFHCDKEITYDKLVQEQVLIPNTVSDFLLSVLDKSYQRDCTRIACEDTSWFAESGFYEEHQKLGNNMDKKVIDESVLLCCYNATKLNDEQMNTVLSSRNYILLEEPFSLYSKN
ncbi:MAG: hypothetical protein M8319_03175 [Nitrosopumilus sp.]|nr:hypothetical protein [Nitrosopumilus sp.]